VGSAAHGCLAGAAQLPVDGPGYEAIRLSRRRYFGHPDTVDFVQSLGRRAQAAGLPLVYVGDMSQPRGGPLPYGHASHQSGLDVDIWFTLEGRKLLQPAAREDLDLPSMLQPSWRSIDPKRFTARQVMLLRLAAADPRVDRIFVNPAIKAALCRGFAGATRNGRAWLQRIRPWWGHDEHFHVRLRCPANSPDCEPQAPLPPGDGCDAGLTAWLRSQHPLPPSPAHPVAARPMPTLPPMCHALLSERPRLAEP
jgi:penicillin-insensitive murein endopeptidase